MLAWYDEHGNVIWFSCWMRSVGVDVEVEMIWFVSVVCVVWCCGELAWDDVNEVVESVELCIVAWK